MSFVDTCPIFRRLPVLAVTGLTPILLMPSIGNAQTSCASIFQPEISLFPTSNLSPTLQIKLKDSDNTFKTSRILTSGLGNIAQIESTLKRLPLTKGAFEYFKNERFEVAIFRPQSSRESIPSKGLSSFHESRRTTSPMGSGRDEAMKKYYFKFRETAEARYLGLSREQYLSDIPVEQRPKYGLLRMAWDDPKAVKSTLGQGYGSDIYLLKKDRIRDRTKFHMGDSLDRLRYRKDVPIIGTSNFRDPSQFKIETWDDGLIPWDARTLFAIETQANLERGELALSFAVNPTLFANAREKSGASDLVNYKRRLMSAPSLAPQPVWLNGAKYIETHIFGNITLNDIEAFEFRGDPPSNSFYNLLASKGIKVIDGRGARPEIYHAH